jgi:two-component system, NarL family, nitrate/nitrite response regulator NarL
MKLKSLSASIEAPAAAAAAVVKLSDSARVSVRAREIVVRPSAETFSSFTRKFIVGQPPAAAAAPESSSTITGSIVGDATVDGIRYVMVKCAPRTGEALVGLSPRERDIVNLIIKGYSNKVIAELLDISAWTVGTHLRRIFAKLGVSSRAAMVAKYLHSPTESATPAGAETTRSGRQ